MCVCVCVCLCVNRCDRTLEDEGSGEQTAMGRTHTEIE